jgi:hypothetical protein
MELNTCFLCGVNVKNENILKHIKKVHFKSTFEDISIFNLNLSKDEWEIERQKITFKKKNKRIEIKGKERHGNKNEINLSIIRTREINNINHKCYLFNREFNDFAKYKYFESIEFKYSRLQKIVNKYLNEIKINDQLPEKIQLEIYNIETLKINELSKKLANFRLSIPDKKDYIRDNCETFYVTWDDISFVHNKIKISPNKAFVQSISMPGSIRIFNEIKIDYFKRRYSKDIYKMIANKGVVLEDISKGVTQIRTLISDHVADLENSKQKIYLNKELTDKELTGKTLQETLLKIAIKNEYLSLAAKLTTTKDKVFGMIENNNGKEEEVLLFVYQSLSKKLLLWENINPNRAAYLFVIESIDLLSLDRIKTIIKSNIEYKRHNLFIGTDIKKTFNLDCSSYYQLNHFDKTEYSQKLKSIINKYR